MKPLVLAVLILAFGVLLAGCLQNNSTPSPSTAPLSMWINIEESGGITGTHSKTWILSDKSLRIVQLNQADFRNLTQVELDDLKDYVRQSGLLSVPLSENNRCADCFAYKGTIQLEGQRRDFSLGGNDVPIAALAGLVQRLNALSATPTPAASVASASATPRPSVAQLKCQVDSDCVTDGCSGQICRSRLDEPVITTCEWREEYACYEKGGCVCQFGRCAWNAGTVACVNRYGGTSQATGSAASSPGVPPEGEGESFDASRMCVKLCQDEKAKGRDFSNGPCLSNEIIRNWVCDVAHDPRQAVDDQEQNTCPAFGTTAQRFVEVDGNCSVIAVE